MYKGPDKDRESEREEERGRERAEEPRIKIVQILKCNKFQSRLMQSILQIGN